jgi:uncharacterized protein CbrC (UPF0167 family)
MQGFEASLLSCDFHYRSRPWNYSAGLILSAENVARRAHCPVCANASGRVRSRYIRTLTDLTR